MNLALLLPAGLAALAALILPLLIHLARRSEQRPTDFAALRWLRQKPKPRHRLRFDEWPLLLLRLLLLALLALWLAKPVLSGSADTRPWVAVSPDVEAKALATMKLPKDARMHWLSPGFPALTDARPDRMQPTSSLLRQLDAELPSGTDLAVIVPADLDGADAQRPRLSRRVDWRVVQASVEAPRAVPAAPLHLAVRYSDERSDALRYVRAAVRSWDASAGGAAVGTKDPPTIAPASQPLENTARQLIWLAPGALPAPIEQWIRNGGTALVDSTAKLPAENAWTPVWRSAEGEPRVEVASLGRGRLMRFTRPLQPAQFPELLEPDFPLQLRAVLQASAPPPTRVEAAEHAPIPDATAYPQAPRDLQPWLLWLIALVFALERWLATAGRMQAAP